MANDTEIIDVEAFHQEQEHKTNERISRQNKKLREENKNLETKTNTLRHAGDAIRRKMWDQEQRVQSILRRLGFDDIASAEARITDEDPWIPGGHAALSNVRARVLLLEDEVAKHLKTNKEAQVLIMETHGKLTDSHNEANSFREEVKRLREECNAARQAAESHAEEARKWRMEVQTTLPDMQATIKHLQNSRQPPLPRNDVEMENASARRGDSTPLRDLVNTTPLATLHSASPVPANGSSGEHYKQKFDLLQTKYYALLESKHKISKRYREDLIGWKKFKSWAVKEESLPGNTKRRMLRRRKVFDEIGPQVDPPGLDLEHDSPAPGKDDQPGHRDIVLVDTSDKTPRLENTTATKPQPSPSLVHRSPLSFLRLHVDPPPRSPESLTQHSSIPSASRSPTPVVPELDRLSISKFKNVSPLSQESLTEPSSAPSPSPIQHHTAAVSAPSYGRKVSPEPEVIIIDSSPERVSSMFPKQESPEQMELSEVPTADHRIKSLKTRSGVTRDTETPRARSGLPSNRKRPRTTLPFSEPPRMSKLGLTLHSPKGNVHSEKSALRRTNTVFALDTPPRARPVVRHHSSPPDSLHVPRGEQSSPSVVRKGKRKAVDIEEEEEGNQSDPFKVGTSCLARKPVIFQTREERTAHLRALGKKPHKEYLAEYMPFKGRGRYSAANSTTEKTVNSEFEIDPARNGGVNHQFDAVVRDKEERKRLEVGDCECCRDYFEAVGPLPSRLQPPLWRSPSSSESQHNSRPCKHKNNIDPTSTPSAEVQAQSIQTRKHEISRHRHNWAPTNTPPGYWHIGFPDTPTTEDINRRANDMHARKFEHAEAEANSRDGRYRKRK